MSDPAAAHTESPLAQRRRIIRTAAACAMLILAAAAAYSDSLHGPFIFDDNAVIEQATAKQPWLAWHMLMASRAVVQATLALNYFIGGDHETGYHVVNLCIHILAALALFGVIRRTLTLPSLGGRFGEKSAASLALCAALLWAVHPLQTQAVTYIIQRFESLMGLFYLMTLYCFIQSACSPKPRAWQVAAVAACALGMGSKEVMVSAPVIVLLYDRTFIAGGFREALRRRRGFYLALAATWLILARSGIAAVSPHTIFGGFQLQGVTPLQYARSEPGVILHYLALTFWPVGLCLDYGWPVANGVEEIAPGMIVIGGLLAATVWALVRKPKWGFIGAWFFLILAPTSSIMPIKDLACDYRMYLPLAAVTVSVVLAAQLAWERLAGAGEGRRLPGQLAAVILIFSVAVALGYATFLRNKDYATAISIWSDTARKAPHNARAFNNLGQTQIVAGHYDEAKRCFDEAIHRKPDYALAYYNRAVALVRIGRSGPAFRDYDQAIELNPGFAPAYAGRARLFFLEGRYDLAILDCNKVIALRPDAVAYNSRGKVYADLERLAEAERDYDKAIELQPDYAIAYVNRGNLRAEAGRLDDAIGDYDRAIALQPDFAEVYCNRGDARDSAGRFAEAVQDYDRAIALRPGLAEAYNSRAMAWYHMKEYGKALADMETCEKLHGNVDPGFREAVMQAAGRAK